MNILLAASALAMAAMDAEHRTAIRLIWAGCRSVRPAARRRRRRSSTAWLGSIRSNIGGRSRASTRPRLRTLAAGSPIGAWR